MLIGARVSGGAADAESDDADVRCRERFFDLPKDATERAVLMVIRKRFAATFGNSVLPSVYRAAMQERVHLSLGIVDDANNAEEVTLSAQQVLAHAGHQSGR